MSPSVAAPRHRWPVFWAMAGVYVTFGVAVSAIAPMLTQVQDDLSVSRGQMGFALGAWALIYIATAPLAGRFLDRFGIGISLSLGGLSIAGTLAARAAASDLATLWVAVAIFGVFGPLVSTSSPTLIAQWFPDGRERRWAVGFSTVAPSLGGVAALALTNPVLLPAFDTWRGVLRFESAVAAFAMLVWIGVYRWAEPPAAPAPGTAPVAESGRVRDLLASPGVRFALALAFTVFFVNHALAPWLPTMLEHFGDLSPTAASTWVAAAGVLGMIASATIPGFANVRRVPWIFMAMLAAVAVGLTLMTVVPPMLAGPLAFATAFRAVLMPIGILTMIEADGVDAGNSGIATGLWFGVGEIGGVTGPLVVGLVADTSAGFDGAALAVAGVAAITALIMATRPQLRT